MCAIGSSSQSAIGAGASMGIGGAASLGSATRTGVLTRRRTILTDGGRQAPASGSTGTVLGGGDSRGGDAPGQVSIR